MEAQRNEALELLARPGWAWGLARALCRDDAEADEALGEARLSALRTPIVPGEVRDARAWIARVVRNAVLRGRRSDQRRAEREALATRAQAQPAVERVLEREESRRAVVRALLTLPEPYRGTLIAHYYDGLRPSVIAQRAGLPQSTVRNRLARGRALLRRELGRTDDREPREWLAVLAPLLTRPESMGPLVLGGLAVGTKSALGVAGVAAFVLMGSLLWWNARPPGADVSHDEGLAASRDADGPVQPVGADLASGLEPAPAVSQRVAIATPADAPTPGVLLRLVDADGLPVPAAQVAWTAMTELSGYWRARTRGEGPDIEQWIAAAGHSGLADAAGELRLPMAGELLVVSARSGELWNRGVVNPGVESFVLILEPSHNLVFEVVDAQSRPVAGVPVGLEMIRPDYAEVVAWSSRTSGDGRVLLAHLEDAMRSSGGEASYLPYAGILAPLGAERVAIDRANLPNGPIRLVLPACGSLRVYLESPEGSPLAPQVWVTITELAQGRQTGDFVRGRDHMLLATVVDGSAEVLWTHVGLDLDLLVEVRGPGGTLQPASERLRGPVREGEQLSVVLTFEEVPARITGRLIDRSGAPLGERQVEMYLREAQQDSVGSEHLTRVDLDEQGRFRAPVDEPLRGVPCRWRMDVREGPTIVLAAAARNLLAPREGELDLGDVQVDEPAIFVAGRVVDADGVPVPEVQVSVARWTRMGGAGAAEIWNWESGVHSPNTDAEGRFELRDDPPPGRFAIAVRVSEFGFGEFVPFERGAQAVLLTLRPAGGLAGRLLLPEGVETANLRVALGAQGRQASRTVPVLAPRPDGAFEFEDLEADTYSAGVRRAWDAQEAPLVEVPGIVVRAGRTNRDPRLDPLDLRSSLHALDLEIFGPDGAPVSQGIVTLRSHATAAEHAVHVRFERGRVRLTGAGPSSDVEVEAPGFRTVRRENVRGPARFDLEPGFEVSVRVPASFELPQDDAQLHLGFWHAQAPRGPSEPLFDSAGNPSGYWGGTPAVEVRLDESRRIDVLLPQQGTWNLGWVLRVTDRAGSSRAWGVRMDFELSVLEVPADGSPRDVLVYPDPEDLARLLREYAGD